MDIEHEAIVVDGGAENRTMTPQECAEKILEGVSYTKTEGGSCPYMDQVRRRVTALCVTAGITRADETTTVWRLVQRSMEIHGQNVTEGLAALEPILSEPLHGDVYEVMRNSGFGAEGPLDTYIMQTLVPAFDVEQGIEYLRDEI